MGLFIGCSTLTLLEVFDYFYDIFKVHLLCDLYNFDITSTHSSL